MKIVPVLGGRWHQRQKYLASARAMLSGKFLLVRKVFARRTYFWPTASYLRICLLDIPECLENFWIFWFKKNNYIQYSPRTFQIIGKVSRKSWLFPDNSEILQTVSNFLDCLETFQNVWKLLRMSGNFLILWKLTCLSGNLRFFF